MSSNGLKQRRVDTNRSLDTRMSWPHRCVVKGGEEPLTIILDEYSDIQLALRRQLTPISGGDAVCFTRHMHNGDIRPDKADAHVEGFGVALSSC